jgi:hypothetical protein
MYLGYDNVGWQSEALGASTYKGVYKKVTPPRSGLLVAIEGYMQGNATNVQCVKAAVLSDVGGKPGVILGMIGAETGNSITILDVQLDTEPRWLSCPMSMWLQGGTPYWLNFRHGFGSSLYYNNQAAQEIGTNVDLEWSAVNETWHRDGSVMTFTLSSKRWCVRAPFVF